MTTHIQPAPVVSAPFTSRLAGRAVVAGIIGGILVDLYLFAVHAAPFPGIYQYVSSALVGKAAYSSPSYIWLGVAIHFAVSIVWALVYAYGANAMRALGRWVVGGLVLGVAVMVVMTVGEMVMKIAPPMTTRSIILGLIGHVVFYGWPVAGYLAWAGKPKGIAQLGLGARDGG